MTSLLMMPKWFLPILILILFAALAVGILIYISPQSDNISIPQPTPTLASTVTPPPARQACPKDAKLCPDGSYVVRIGPDCEFAPCPPISTPTSTPISTPTTDPRSSWTTHRNEEFRFEISFPPNQQIVDDTYGWPKAILMLYGGGQSYSLVIEVWDSPAEYERKYEHQMDSITVENINGKYITLLNMNDEEEVDLIIDTFKSID